MNAPPLNPLPPVVWILALPLIAVEVVLSLGAQGMIGGPEAVGWRLQAMERLAFFPDILRAMIEQRYFPAEQVLRLIAYPLVHGNFTHLMFVVVILLALGKMVGEAFKWWAVVAIVVVATVVPALLYTAIPGMKMPLIGGYPPVYGLIGGFTYLLWMRMAGRGGNRFIAFRMIGFLVAVQILFSAIGGGGLSWIADLFGFATGFGMSFIVAPGGFARLREMMRQR